MTHHSREAEESIIVEYDGDNSIAMKDFPFKDSTFTGIFISYVLHYAHECKQCLDEILRILKDPGIIVFSKE